MTDEHERLWRVLDRIEPFIIPVGLVVVAGSIAAMVWMLTEVLP